MRVVSLVRTTSDNTPTRFVAFLKREKQVVVEKQKTLLFGSSTLVFLDSTLVGGAKDYQKSGEGLRIREVQKGIEKSVLFPRNRTSSFLAKKPLYPTDNHVSG